MYKKQCHSKYCRNKEFNIRIWACISVGISWGGGSQKGHHQRPGWQTRNVVTRGRAVWVVLNSSTETCSICRNPGETSHQLSRSAPAKHLVLSATLKNHRGTFLSNIQLQPPLSLIASSSLSPEKKKKANAGYSPWQTRDHRGKGAVGGGVTNFSAMQKTP